MGDHSELKRLAVELAAANDLFNECPQDNEIGDAWSLANDRFTEAASPEVILALIAENESLKGPHDWLAEDLIKELVDNAQALQENSDLGESDPFAIVLLAAASRIRRQEGNIDKLKTENEQLAKTASCWDRLNIENKALSDSFRAERDELKAENEVLRDDNAQNQYDANAWRNQEESVWIEVFHSEGDDPFISAITGQITVEQLALIQAEILEYREDYFEKGSGLYVFKCAHYQAHYDNVGMREPVHWETDFESHSPFPWEEAAAMGKGEQS
ncbi:MULTISPECIES: hypothetical protein [unclassified Pseudomonas]|uniref:hypothetical protein n=1 Tax=unclassified Pseudomonas TaxID=196821 RepID=UPI00147631DB|nr:MULTISPECIES: hypothetical protein [unclassified Pseudomonas]NMY36178.1 hypothetical protein [Pseudomonas sp. WS 5078]NMY58919.1 hypothetical protein [Pseudomonas sp. WS 5354]